MASLLTPTSVGTRRTSRKDETGAPQGAQNRRLGTVVLEEPDQEQDDDDEGE